jgi:D-arginine dehydrogenase
MPPLPTPIGPDRGAPPDCDVVVVGAGIAGLATACFLMRDGLRVVVVEREPAPFMGASGKNAAIFRHAEPSRVLVELVHESRLLLDTLCAGERWLDKRGAVYLSTDVAALGAMRDALTAVGIAHEVLTGSALAARAPDIVVRENAGLFVADDGVIDLDVTRARLLRDLLAANGLVVGRRVTAIESGHSPRVVLDDGHAITANAVVVAAGAHMRALTSLPLTPMRRHLVELQDSGRALQEHPVVWRLDDEVYYRPGPLTVVASPCDEEVSAPDDDAVREHAAATTTQRLVSLLGHAPVIERVWACLRTWAPDRLPVAGALPGAPGVFVTGGLGGVGVSAGIAVAAHAARAVISGVEHPALTPARFGA